MTLLPKNSSFTPEGAETRQLGASSIVMYENDNAPLLACILEFKKNKYLLLNQRARELDLPANRLYSFNLLVPQNLTTKAGKADHLEKLYSQAKEAADKIFIEELWNLIGDEERDYSCHELAKNYLGKLSSESHIAFRLALLNDRIYFKRKNETFRPRPKDTVEQLKTAEAERKRKLEIEEKAYSIFKEKISNPDLPLPAELTPFLKTMSEIAAEANQIEAARIREVRDFIHNFSEKYNIQIPGGNHERVYNFLRLINYYDSFTNLSLIRNRLNIEHDSDAVQESKKIDITEALNENERSDLTHLECFTIDDSSTKDMDDAISVEFRQDGYMLGIHISDVASAIKPDSILDKACLKRLTSIYLPDRTVNMLPDELSQDKISLVKGETRPALSFLFNISRDFEIIDCDIKLSVIKVRTRYNYEEANIQLEDPNQHIFEVLHNITATHDMKRIENGAIQLHKKECYVNIKDKNTLELQEIDENSPSRRLISELMVIANSHLAKFAKENNIPFIYRTQEKPDKSTVPKHAKSSESPSGDIAGRMNLKKSLNLTTPRPHSGLGVDYYCQATSPIRRYLDLCNQRQIVSFLKNGKAIYTEAQLRELLFHTDEDIQRFNVINKESKRFWLLKYLEMHVYRQRDISGTIVRTDLKNPLVELEEVYMATQIKLSGKYQAGDKLKLKISSINPAYDYIKLEVI